MDKVMAVAHVSRSWMTDGTTPRPPISASSPAISTTVPTDPSAILDELVVWPIGEQRVLAILAVSGVEQQRVRSFVEARATWLAGAPS